MERKETLLDIADGIAVITINRPDKLNAVSDNTVAEIESILDEVEENDSAKVLIITGMGEKSFCAGHDISTFDNMSEYEVRKSCVWNHSVCHKMENYCKPIIAAVNGYAFGAGCEIACSCDFRIASENARFGLPEVSLGIIPGQGGTQRLPRLIGMGPARYYTITNEHMKADRAYQLGLVEKVVPLNQLLDTCKKVAGKIMNNSPSAVRIARNAMNRGINMDITNGTMFEIESFISAYYTEDRTEGVQAFIEKRKANFKGN